MTVPVPLPTLNPNDTAATLVRWLVDPGTHVERGQPIATIETTKTAIEVESPAAGWLVARARPGDSIAVGTPFAEISPRKPARADTSIPYPADRIVTAKAKALMARHGVTEEMLPPQLRLIRAADIEALLAPAGIEASPDWDAVLRREDYTQLMDLLGALRRRMKEQFDRHVPLGTLLNDRTALATASGFGAGASVYDECLILGDVTVGQHCWVGPNTVLDGSGGGLTIGDWSSIGTGAHVYTHHTIDQVLSGGAAGPYRAPTRIGRCCFIAPMAMIAPGADIGDHSFVAAFSYVEGAFPPYSYLAGAPARVVGRIQVHGDRVSRRLFNG